MRDWLIEARKAKGLTARQVSEKLAITESYYNMIEHRSRQKKMDITLVTKLSDVLGVPVTEIIANEAPRS